MTDILTIAQEQLYHDMHAVHEAMARGYVFMSKEALAAKLGIESVGDMGRAPLPAADYDVTSAAAAADHADVETSASLELPHSEKTEG